MPRFLLFIVLAIVTAGGCSSRKTTTDAIPTARRTQETARLQSALSRRGGDPILGREIFRGRCAACHTAFGQGGDLAPDLTSYLRREDYRELLLATLLNPTAPAARAAEAHASRTLTTHDGTRHTGILIEDTGDQLILATAGGNRVTLAKSNLDPAAGTNPRHLLAGLSDSQVRNLFAYLLREAPATR